MLRKWNVTCTFHCITSVCAIEAFWVLQEWWGHAYNHLGLWWYYQSIETIISKKNSSKCPGFVIQEEVTYIQTGACPHEGSKETQGLFLANWVFGCCNVWNWPISLIPRLCWFFLTAFGHLRNAGAQLMHEGKNLEAAACFSQATRTQGAVGVCLHSSMYSLIEMYRTLPLQLSFIIACGYKLAIACIAVQHAACCQCDDRRFWRLQHCFCSRSLSTLPRAKWCTWSVWKHNIRNFVAYCRIDSRLQAPGCE